MSANPYAPPRSDSEPPAAAGQTLAGRGARLAAQLLDLLIFGLICAPSFVTVAGALAAKVNPIQAVRANMTMFVLTLLAVAGLGIYQMALIATRGQTIGKRVMRIQIVKVDGSPAGFGAGVVARIWAMAIANAILSSFNAGLGSILGLVDTVLVFRADRRCLHDLIAGTKVVELPRVTGRAG